MRHFIILIAVLIMYGCGDPHIGTYYAHDPENPGFQGSISYPWMVSITGDNICFKQDPTGYSEFDFWTILSRCQEGNKVVYLARGSILPPEPMIQVYPEVHYTFSFEGDKMFLLSGDKKLEYQKYKE